MPEVGFEPTRTIRPADLKSAPLDLSGIQALPHTSGQYTYSRAFSPGR